VAGGAEAAVGDVVVAREDRVVQPALLEDAHRLVGDLPLLRRPVAVDDVTEVGDEGDLELLLVVDEPSRLRGVRLAAIAGHEEVAGAGRRVAGVELRVRQHRQQEAGAVGGVGGFGRRGEREGHARGDGQGRPADAAGDRQSHGSPDRKRVREPFGDRPVTPL
jgi:hypothetical protein